jgi:hypothetical protein
MLLTVTKTVAGAMEIQKAFEMHEWGQESGFTPVTWTRYLRHSALTGLYAQQAANRPEPDGREKRRARSRRLQTARFAPCVDRVDRVPPVIPVVTDRTAQEDSCAAGRKGQAARRANLGGREGAASLRETHAPASALSRPHANHSAKHGDTSRASDAASMT